MHISTGQVHDSRRTIGALVFIGCCLVSAARMTWRAPLPNPEGLTFQNVAKRSDQRFGELKSSLADCGVVGYIGESGTSAEADYYLTQYALAPLVVDRSASHPLVVGNFPTSSPSVSALGNLELIRDFGHGVLLYARKGTRQ
jgi:hypothetical protein